MYECTGPTLVLHTPTYHPVLNHHTGYIFGYYDFQLRKPRELFFQHYYEALTYALRIGAKLLLNIKDAPQRVAAEEYLTALADDSQFIEMPDFRKNTRHAGMFGQKPSGAPESRSEVAEVLDSPTLDMPNDEAVQEIDYFAEETDS